MIRTSIPAEANTEMATEIAKFTDALRHDGVLGALQYLNSRTPHRYTGVFRFDGDMLRSEVLFDRYEPTLRKGEDVPLQHTYCSLVGQQETPIEITNAATDPRVLGKITTPVVSYCGILVRDHDGKAFGTLCHYDLNRCQERTSDLPLLEAAAGLLYQALRPA